MKALLSLLFQSTSCSSIKRTTHKENRNNDWLTGRKWRIFCQDNYYLFPWPSYFLASALAMAVIRDFIFPFCLSHSCECVISITSYQVGLKDELQINCGQRSKVTQHVFLAITQKFTMLIMTTSHRCLRGFNEKVPKGQRSSLLWRHYILQKMLWPLFNITVQKQQHDWYTEAAISMLEGFSHSHCSQASLLGSKTTIILSFRWLYPNENIIINIAFHSCIRPPEILPNGPWRGSVEVLCCVERQSLASVSGLHF